MNVRMPGVVKSSLVLVGAAAAIAVGPSQGASAAPAQTETPPPPCSADSAPALRFEGLRSRMTTGPDHEFSVEEGDSASAVSDPVVRAVRAGQVLYDETVEVGETLTIRLPLGTPPITVEADFVETDPSGASCARTITRRVTGLRRIYFRGYCGSEQLRPRRVIIACADAGLYLKRLRWSSWNGAHPTGRGRLRANDCNPYCAAGTYHEYPARVRASRPRRCPGTGRYVYTRLRVRLPGARPQGIERTWTLKLRACEPEF